MMMLSLRQTPKSLYECQILPPSRQEQMNRANKSKTHQREGHQESAFPGLRRGLPGPTAAAAAAAKRSPEHSWMLGRDWGPRQALLSCGVGCLQRPSMHLRTPVYDQNMHRQCTYWTVRCTYGICLFVG